ncbi:UDP-N-acetylmuramoyl-L-alanyl-D-glutamate--2,6-diaminopimelate ligase [Flavobacterium sp. W21_SRS_FM6]|uniref:UDP-N-acetylmuramoyl-L-alanyl-D-glutamate--2, 6-diaminopimelate ligase n=1 Tax=Flavobacterium sp. W21_SRS_FM6 TaxID=3240268 RepID=UPI003F920110
MRVDMLSIESQFAEPFAQSIQSLLANFGISAPDIMITELVLDSRDVAIHKAFIAIKGHSRDGRDFIPQAVSLGAKVIIAQCDSAELHGQVTMRDNSLIICFFELAEKLSKLAAYFYQHPANSLSVVAVTGTNGKTSVVQLCNQLAYLLGERSASIGTLGSGIYHQLSQLHSTVNTTPDAISIQRLLAEFVGEGASQVALEASSHALVQKRLAALKTDVAVFTNLSRDHLDYHHTMDDYARAKRLLLAQPSLKYAVLNGNDPEHLNWLATSAKNTQVVVYGLNMAKDSVSKDYQYCLANNIQFTAFGVRFSLESSWGNCELRLNLVGEFNISNALAAITAQLCLGKNLKNIAYIAQKLQPVAGRMELFSHPGRATIVVDYAHTPDALEKSLLAVRQHCQGQLWCVFGCGGDRDTGKRPLMGAIAERLADRVVITDDNVRSEEPKRIVEDILQGCRDPQTILVEHSRTKAIEIAAQQCTEHDFILVAGKGHEDYQIIGHQSQAYDERAFVKQFQQGKTS